MRRRTAASIIVSTILLLIASSGAVMAIYALPAVRVAAVQPQPATLPALTPQSPDNPPLPVPSTNGQVMVPGWLQAGASRKLAPAIPRIHVLFLDEAQVLTGHIRFPQGFVPGDTGLAVSFLQEGKTIRSGVLSPDGNFSITGLVRGIYGVGIRGENSLIAFSLFIGDRSDLISAGYSDVDVKYIIDQQQNRLMDVDAMAVHVDDYPLVMKLLRDKIDGDAIVYNTINGGRLQVPPEMDAKSIRPGTTIQHHAVALRRDGRLLGRVRKPIAFTDGTVSIQPVSAVSVSILQRGTEVAQSVSDATGEFELTGLAPGSYSLVARSDEGFAAFGVEVVDPGTFDEQSDLQLDFCIMEGFGRLMEQDELLEEEFCCGAAVGGCCGGGGYGGGACCGGFPWGLAGLGLLGLTNHHNHHNNHNNPVSPDDTGTAHQAP